MTSTPAGYKNLGQTRTALTLVEARLPSDLFLMARFEEFYHTIVELKARLARPAAQVQFAVTLQQARTQILSLLSDQETQVARSSTLLGMEMYRQAQRVMACLADDIFSAVPSGSVSLWESLEMELFHTTQQGGLAPNGACIKKLAPLLQQDDPVYRELAAVYFYALALREQDQRGASDYLSPLFQMIAGNQKDTATENQHIFPQSYAHTLAENKVTMLPSADKWWLALALILLAWIAVSWVLWKQLSDPISEKLQDIQQTLRP